MLSHPVVSDFAAPRTVAHQAHLTVAFSRHEYWSGLPFPTPGMLLLKVTSVDFCGGPVVKNLPASVGDTGLIPGPGRFHMLLGS